MCELKLMMYLKFSHLHTHTHWIRWSFSVQSLCSFLIWSDGCIFYWNDPQEAKRNGCARFKLMKWNLVPLMGSSGLRGSLNAARDSAGFPWCCHGDRLILEWQNCQHSQRCRETLRSICRSDRTSLLQSSILLFISATIRRNRLIDHKKISRKLFC